MLAPEADIVVRGIILADPMDEEDGTTDGVSQLVKKDGAT
jgi:hypothetical protein